MRRTQVAFGILVVLFTISAAPALAELAADSEMELVSRSWLAYMAGEPDGWAGSREPWIVAAEYLEDEDGVLARVFHVAPAGYMVVPVIRELPPILAFSTESRFDVSQEHGFVQLLREVLRDRLERFAERNGSLKARGESAPRDHRATWDLLLQGPESFRPGLKDGLREERDIVGPLCTTVWHQNYPYNLLAPMGDGGQCLVGCVATAAAQVMKRYNWPPAGIGGKQYYWNGDQSCGGSTPGQNLYADFSDPYDWDNMPNACNPVCNQTQQDALSELCYEVGVAFSMDFGSCGSGAYTSQAVSIMPAYFDYSSQIDQENRSSHTVDSWFQIIREEVDNGRPMIYSFRYDSNSGHAVVADGWAEVFGQLQYHINYGWGGDHSAWYTIDNIYHSQDPMQEFIIRRIMPADPWTVSVAPDGSGDYPTIQAAIDDVFAGCVVELADGVYTGEGNRNLDLNCKQITVRSQSGDPSACIIDCEGDESNPRIGFIFDSGDPSTVVIEGITIANGYGGYGGGALIEAASSPTFVNCIFLNCAATQGGGAYVSDDSSPQFIDCRFIGNTATGFGGGLRFRNASGLVQSCVFEGNTTDGAGGAIHIRGSSPTIDGCTLFGNGSVGGGGGIALAASSSPVIQNTIIAFGTQGEALYRADDASQPTMTCCCIHGNAGGPGLAGDYLGVNDNFDQDPLFCDAESGDLTLCADSPCLAGAGPCGSLIGALDQGCGSCGGGTGVEEWAGSGVFYIAPCAPNPFRGATTITFTVPETGGSSRVSLNVYDPAGRLVRNLVKGNPGAGVHQVTWQGRDGSGRSVASGIYYLRLTGSGREVTRSVLLLR